MRKKYKARAKDRFGTRLGTNAAKVNKAITTELQTVDEIAKAANLPVRKVLARLYTGCEKGLFVRVKSIRFALSPSGAAENAEKLNDSSDKQN